MNELSGIEYNKRILDGGMRSDTIGSLDTHGATIDKQVHGGMASRIHSSLAYSWEQQADALDKAVKTAIEIQQHELRRIRSLRLARSMRKGQHASSGPVEAIEDALKGDTVRLLSTLSRRYQHEASRQVAGISHGRRRGYSEIMHSRERPSRSRGQQKENPTRTSDRQLYVDKRTSTVAANQPSQKRRRAERRDGQRKQKQLEEVSETDRADLGATRGTYIPAGRLATEEFRLKAQIPRDGSPVEAVSLAQPLRIGYKRPRYSPESVGESVEHGNINGHRKSGSTPPGFNPGLGQRSEVVSGLPVATAGAHHGATGIASAESMNPPALPPIGLLQSVSGRVPREDTIYLADRLLAHKPCFWIDDDNKSVVRVPVGRCRSDFLKRIIATRMEGSGTWIMSSMNRIRSYYEKDYPDGPCKLIRLKKLLYGGAFLQRSASRDRRDQPLQSSEDSQIGGKHPVETLRRWNELGSSAASAGSQPSAVEVRARTDAGEVEVLESSGISSSDESEDTDSDFDPREESYKDPAEQPPIEPPHAQAPSADLAWDSAVTGTSSVSARQPVGLRACQEDPPSVRVLLDQPGRMAKKRCLEMVQQIVSGALLYRLCGPTSAPSVAVVARHSLQKNQTFLTICCRSMDGQKWLVSSLQKMRRHALRGNISKDLTRRVEALYYSAGRAQSVVASLAASTGVID